MIPSIEIGHSGMRCGWGIVVIGSNCVTLVGMRPSNPESAADSGALVSRFQKFMERWLSDAVKVDIRPRNLLWEVQSPRQIRA